MSDLMDWLGEIGEKYGFTESGTEREGTVLHAQNSEAEINVLTAQDRRDSNGYSGSATGIEAKTQGDTSRVAHGEVMAGYREDGEHWKAGVEGKVGVGTREVDFQEKYDLDERIVLEGDVGVGTASAGATVTDEGISVGAQANYVEGSITAGTTGTGDRDEEARFGLSAGGGAAGRIHYGDRDGDGNPEYGIGVDVGPVSVDIKTEDPLRAGIKAGMQNAMPGVGHVLSQGLDYAVDGNMTNRAGEALEDAGEAAGEALDDAGEALSDASDYISDAIWGDDDD